MYFKIEYSNGYCTCDEEIFIKADSEEQAEEFAEEGLAEYGEQHTNGVQGYDFFNGWDSEEEAANYEEGLSFCVTEIDREEFLENGGDEN